MKRKFNDNLQFPLRLQFEFHSLFFQKLVDRDELNPLRIDLYESPIMNGIFQYGIEPSLQQYRMHLFHLYADGFFRPFLNRISFLPRLQLYTPFRFCESYMLFSIHHLFREFTFEVNISYSIWTRMSIFLINLTG